MSEGLAVSAVGGDIVVAGSFSNINAPTTGLVEEVLRTFTIPAGILNVYKSFSAVSVWHHAANTNAAAVFMKLGTMAGPLLAARGDSGSGNRIIMGADAIVTAPGQLDCLSWVARAVGTSSYLVQGPHTGLDFNSDLTIVFSASSAIQAGDIILDAFWIRYNK